MPANDWHDWPQEERKCMRFNGGNSMICCSGCGLGLTTRGALGDDSELSTPNRWWCAGCVPDDRSVEPRAKTWGALGACYRETTPARQEVT